MTDKYQCPKCKSNRIKIGYPDIQCLACGWSEALIDFPISWSWHRYYCREYGAPDPGPCEPPEDRRGPGHKARAPLYAESSSSYSSQETTQST